MDKKFIYKADYSKSKNANCKGCKNNIEKDVLRLIYRKKSHKFDGTEAKFYHPDCFFKKFHPRSQFYIDGFATLKNEDQETLMKLLDSTKANSRKCVEQSESESDVDSALSSGSEGENIEPALKKKKSNLQDKHDELDTLIRQQNEEFHKLREQIKEFVGIEGQKFILNYNIQYVPRDRKEILDHITDVIYFGAINPCTVNECNSGKFVFDGNTTYRCTGLLSVFGDCNKKVKEPERRPVEIPEDYDEFKFLYREFNSQRYRLFKENPKAKAIVAKQPARTNRVPARNREMLLKDGAVVDPLSGLREVAHVYSGDDKLYTVVLDNVDLSPHKDRNSYYKMQLLESDADDPKRYWVFRSWGRINEDIGDHKLEEFNDEAEAITNFHNIYQKKTKNQFVAKKFCKLPKKYHEVPCSSKSIQKPYKLIDSNVLHGSVQNLLKLLMNKDIMSGVMVKFNLDLNKMPLGNVRSMQIAEAFQVLRKIEEKIKRKASNESLIESSNQFYSIIPHKACSKDTITSREDLIKKAEMLQDLNNIQFAYEFVYKSGECGENILDDFYAKLNNVIEPLHENDEPFKIIKEAFDSTKSSHDCHFDHIFMIQRNGEEIDGSEMFDGLQNHRLLWHGSRITNINQILAHGLKIAPAEATAVIGCMLGKGLYFSDAVANSIEFCYASQSNNIGVVLLYEVALGNAIESLDPDNIDELPDGQHSVHGVGKISPQSTKCLNNATIYSGPLKRNDQIESYFEYNEFVVYNNQQVKLKYLVQFKFNDNSVRRINLKRTILNMKK